MLFLRGGIGWYIFLLCMVACKGIDDQHEKADFAPAQLGVEVIYIANEGVLIKAGEEKVLIDALHYPYLDDYVATPDTILGQMMKGVPPYDGVDLMLISHPHGDHFHPELVIDYLKTFPDVQLVASEEVEDSLSGYAGYQDIIGQVLSTAYRPLEEDLLQVGDITVKLLHMPHSGYRTSTVRIQNLATMVSMNKVNILHLGDVGFEEEVFEAFDFQAMQIHLGLIPDWLLANKAGAALIKRHLPVDFALAMHVSPKIAGQMRQRIKDFFPNALVLTQTGTTYHF